MEEMDSKAREVKSNIKLHVVCIPCPVQGHIKPMFKLAQLLHSQLGIHITFVNTEYNHRRLLRSRGSHSLDGLNGFKFETIPDSLPPSDADATQDCSLLARAILDNFLDPFKKLLIRLNDDNPPVSVIISDVIMPFAHDAAFELNLPLICLWTAAAHGFMGFLQYSTLLNKGIVPFQDASFQTDGSLDMIVDWVPSMKGITLKYMPSFIRITNKDDALFNLMMISVDRVAQSNWPIIFNTFDAFEPDVLEDISKIVLGPMYTIGPLHFQLKHIPQGSDVNSLGSNLWKEDSECLEWLDSKNPKSVVYVSFGSITTMTHDNLIEFAWGLANSNHPFLWIVRPDIVTGDTAIIPPEFLSETKDRGILSSWCDQEKVLSHESVGGFLTHCGWNSTLDSLCGGVPLLCWPFFAEQQTNCWCSVKKWGIGMEIDSDVSRDVVEKQVRELMEGEKGKEMTEKVMEWKRLAEDATTSTPNASSILNFEKFVAQQLYPLKKHLN